MTLLSATLQIVLAAENWSAKSCSAGQRSKIPIDDRRTANKSWLARKFRIDVMSIR